MRLLIRTFNRNINSKTGDPLPPGKTRGTPEWRQFEEIALDVLGDLGIEVVEQLENPRVPDRDGFAGVGYVHQTYRERPQGLFFYMQMHLRDLFTLDTRGWGADHSGILEPPKLESISLSDSVSLVEALAEEYRNNGGSKHEQPKIGESPKKGLLSLFRRTKKIPGEFILVPLQIPRDYVAIHHSKIKGTDFVDLVSDWAERAKFPVALKLHPFGMGDLDIRRRVEKRVAGSKYVFQADGNIQELIAKSNGVWTVNSGVGFEALIQGKPVITNGNCDYKWATYRVEESGVEGIKEFLLNSGREYREMCAKFIYFYLRQHGYWLRPSEQELNRSRMRDFFGKVCLSSRQ